MKYFKLFEQFVTKNNQPVNEAPTNRYPSTTVTAIDAKKMTAVAKIITDTELFPELDGESVCPKSMSEVKDTIDVIVKLPKALAGDYDSFGKFLDKMTDKYGADQVIWMNAENADQIEDSKLNSVFSELEEALSDLDTCFAEFESMNDFAKAYNRLAKAVDKVLAVMSKIKPTTEAADSTNLESVDTIARKINNALRAGAEVKNSGGDDFIVFRKGWTFPTQDLPKYIAILSTYPKSTMGMHPEVPGVPSIKIIK